MHNLRVKTNYKYVRQYLLLLRLLLNLQKTNVILLLLLLNNSIYFLQMSIDIFHL